MHGWIGIMGWIVLGWFSIITCGSPQNQKAVGLFHLLCLPYIITSFVSGLMFEIRLFVPILINCQIRSESNLEKIKPNSGNRKLGFEIF